MPLPSHEQAIQNPDRRKAGSLTSMPSINTFVLKASWPRTRIPLTAPIPPVCVVEIPTCDRSNWGNVADPNAEMSSRSITFTETASDSIAVSTRSATTTVSSIWAASAMWEVTVIDPRIRRASQSDFCRNRLRLASLIQFLRCDATFH